MYANILVATDGSELATIACRQGLSLAEALGSRVHALYAADVPSDVSWQLVDEDWRSTGQSIVSPLAEEASDRGLEVEASVRGGAPRREIIDYAAEHEIDLVVCGTHGRTGLRRLIAGSVASGVVRDSPAPVLTVSAHVGTVVDPIETILIATDGRPGVESAVEQGLSLAAALEAHLHVLSVVDDTQSQLSVVLEAFEEQATEAVSTVEHRAARRDVSTTRSIEHGVPHEAITGYAEGHDVDLVVMGTESRTGLDRFAFGSCSQRVVGTAPVPVVTARTLE
ncbi:universal stress protein [Natrononativus amylolyticus]|uniref:universal stress protein n=1 Tax=Natrononativus amylolyticus TaxID=2963434 RepID=UPI0020CD644D|nr:universal stress protein [Natrononativus amylolyticus]